MEFAAIINREFSAPGTIGVGYNTIAFDDEITRFMFWRNLIDPYAREWRNNCGRWDLINVMRAAFALRPDGVVWPIKEDGRQSFRLEDIAKANGLHHESAHDALSDVHATIELARLIKSTNPKLFEFCFNLHKKTYAMVEMSLDDRKPFIHVAGANRDTGGIAIMMPMAIHPTNKNEVIAWDLSKDPSQLLDINATSMRTRMFTKAADAPEGFERMPIRAIAANKSPVVIKNLKVLSDADATKLGVDKLTALDNGEKLLAVLKARDIPTLLREVYARDLEKNDIDEALYGGFIHDDDRYLLDQLRMMSPDAIAGAQPKFRDRKLGELFFRFKARNFPETLTQDERTQWKAHLHEKLVVGVDGNRTIPALQLEIAEKLPNADARSRRILMQILEYVDLMTGRPKGVSM